MPTPNRRRFLNGCTTTVATGVMGASPFTRALGVSKEKARVGIIGSTGKADIVQGAEGIGLLAGDNILSRYSFPSGAIGHFASRRTVAGNPTRFAIQVFGSKGVIEMESGYLAIGLHFARQQLVAWEKR